MELSERPSSRVSSERNPFPISVKEPTIYHAPGRNGLAHPAASSENLGSFGSRPGELFCERGERRVGSQAMGPLL